MFQNPRTLIKNLFNEDQKDRKSWRVKSEPSTKTAWKKIERRDRKRIKKLEFILKSNPPLRGIDYFYAGMIFQHGVTLSKIKTANELALKGHELGEKRASWLYAASTDRILMMQGKKQKFGTQYRMKDGKYILHPVQSNVSDTLRKRYNVVSLAQAKRRVIDLNKNYEKIKQSKRVGITMRG